MYNNPNKETQNGLPSLENEAAPPLPSNLIGDHEAILSGTQQTFDEKVDRVCSNHPDQAGSDNVDEITHPTANQEKNKIALANHDLEHLIQQKIGPALARLQSNVTLGSGAIPYNVALGGNQGGLDETLANPFTPKWAEQNGTAAETNDFGGAENGIGLS